MNLTQQTFMLVDFQTTGTRPDNSFIIEAAWGLYRASQVPETVVWEVHLLRLPESETLPRRIQKLTGLAATYDQGPTLTYSEMSERLVDFLDANPTVPLLLHYAPFKKVFD